MKRDMSLAARTMTADASHIFKTLDGPLTKKTADDAKRPMQLETSPDG